MWAALTAGLAFWHGNDVGCSSFLVFCLLSPSGLSNIHLPPINFHLLQGEQIFLLGNPLLWWCNLLAVCLYPLLWLVYTLAGARQVHYVDSLELKR